MKLLIVFISIINILGVISLYNDLYLVNDKNLHIYVLNVGQGDALLIKTPSGNWGMIDSGKNSIVLEELAKILPTFTRKLDFILLTHPDADHIEGFLEIVKRYEIDTVFTNKNTKYSALFTTLIQELFTHSVNHMELDALNDFYYDDILFDIIWPINNDDYTIITDSNDISISMIISYKEFSFYTAGDLSKEYEIQSLSDKEDVDIMKVSHHGSQTSTSIEVLNKLTPEIAVISAGKDNSYGHPHPEILDNLTQHNIQILRTDELGTIKFITDGRNIHICIRFNCNERSL